MVGSVQNSIEIVRRLLCKKLQVAYYQYIMYKLHSVVDNPASMDFYVF